MDQYKIGTTTNSESTMHTLTKFPITANSFSINEEDIGLLMYDDVAHSFEIGHIWAELIRICEDLRQRYQETGRKEYWNTLVRILPSAWLQTRTWTGNYAILKNIYYARRNHKLKEWHDFCDFIEQLPYAEYLILTGEK